MDPLLGEKVENEKEEASIPSFTHVGLEEWGGFIVQLTHIPKALYSETSLNHTDRHAQPNGVIFLQRGAHDTGYGLILHLH